MFAYRPPIKKKHKKIFFEEVTNMETPINKYDNILIAGDLNIDTNNNKKEMNYCLCDVIITLLLSNLIYGWFCSGH